MKLGHIFQFEPISEEYTANPNISDLIASCGDLDSFKFYLKLNIPTNFTWKFCIEFLSKYV
nr:ORF43 [Bracoviriform inaniti]